MGVYNNENGVLSPIAGRGNIDGVYRANGILGAKNLLKVPYHHTTGVVLPVGGSVENAGLTYTHNADGSLSVSGTATTGSYCIFNRKQDWADCNFYGKKIKMSVTPITQGAFMQLYDTDNGVTLFRTDASTGEVEFTMPESLVNNTSWNISLNFPTGAVLNGETFYSMVRLASDTDSTYQPYAKTNKELTEDVAEIKSDLLYSEIKSSGSISETINANSVKAINIDVTKTGYIPIGIIGIDKTGTSTGYGAIVSFRISNNDAVVTIDNTSTSSITITKIDVTILYKKA